MAIKRVLFEKALYSLGGRGEFEQKHRQYSESVHFIDKNRSRLLEKYDGKWIAVYNSRVVTHGKRYGDVAKAVRQKNLPIGEVALKFLSSRRVMTLF